MRASILLGMAACAALTGCGVPLPDAQDDKAAIQAVDALRRGELRTLEAQSGPDLPKAELEANAGWMRSLFPPGEPLSVKRLAFRSNVIVGKPAMLDLSEAYDFPDRVVYADVLLSSAGAPHRWVVDGLHLNMRMKPARTPPAGPKTLV